MDINIHGKNLTIDDDMRQQIERKLNHVNRHLTGITEATVELAWVPARCPQQRSVAQITIYADGDVIRSEQRAPTVTAAINSAAGALDRQIAKYKSQAYRSERSKRNTPLRTSEAEEAAQPTLVNQGLTLPGGEIVRTKQFPMEPMSVEDAAFKMQMLGHSFFMFFNRECDQHNLLYVREDGNYGLIQPQV